MNITIIAYREDGYSYRNEEHSRSDHEIIHPNTREEIVSSLARFFLDNLVRESWAGEWEVTLLRNGQYMESSDDWELQREYERGVRDEAMTIAKERKAALDAEKAKRQRQHEISQKAADTREKRRQLAKLKAELGED